MNKYLTHFLNACCIPAVWWERGMLSEWHDPPFEELRNKEVVLSAIEEEQVGEGHRGEMKI